MQQTNPQNASDVANIKVNGTSKNSNKLLKSFVILLLAIALILGGIFLGKNVFTKNNSAKTPTNSTSENSTTTPPVSSPIATDTVKDCSGSYSNSTFLKLKFDYDKCYWTLKETKKSSTQTQITLTNTTSDIVSFNLQAVPNMGGVSECKDFGYKIVGPKTRGRVNTNMSGKDFAYYQAIFVKGSKDYNEVMDAYGLDPTKSSYCYPTLSFVTDSTVTDPGTGDKMKAIMSINFSFAASGSDATSLTKVDAIVKGMSY